MMVLYVINSAANWRSSVKVGDLVKRKITSPIDKQLEEKSGKYGFILKIEAHGIPPRPRAMSSGQNLGKCILSVGVI
jgi:hypothetical protein